MNSAAIAKAGFRDKADAAASAALSRHRIPTNSTDITSAGFSICVRRTGNADATRKRVARIFIAQLTLTFLAIVAGGLLTWLSVKRPGTTTKAMHGLLLYSGIALLGIGWLAVCCAVNIQGVLVRRLLRTLGAPVPRFQTSEGPIVVHIEDPANCHETKLVVEELGLLYCDAVRRLIVIEGIFHRYVILGRDVIHCEIYQPRNTRHHFLTYRIGGSKERVSLALSYNSAAIELRRQLSGNRARPPLAGILERTLGIVVYPQAPGFPVLPAQPAGFLESAETGPHKETSPATQQTDRMDS